MARSRNIKPGFFTNDELAECEPLARLLFAGLWTEADREGRLEDRPKKLKAAILPYDSCDADALLQQLATRDFIARYQVDGCGYIQIVSFGKHQDPHYKEKASEIPAPPGHIDTGTTGGAPSGELRAKIIAMDGACRRCQSTIDLTLDHIIPRSKGGTHDESNLQTLCRRCNASKNNRQARPIIGLSSADDRSSIGKASADDLGGESPLIPDSLIPDSLNLIPDSLHPPTPKGEGRFPDFWSAWPASTRKQDRKKCLAKWQRQKLDTKADTIVADIEARKQSKQWLDGFEPAPLTYLNGERWADGTPVQQVNGSHEGYL